MWKKENTKKKTACECMTSGPQITYRPNGRELEGGRDNLASNDSRNHKPCFCSIEDGIKCSSGVPVRREYMNMGWARESELGSDRSMRCLVVDMNERSFNIWQYFYFILQLLTDIMRLP